MSFLMVPRALKTTGAVVVWVPHSLNLDFQVFVFAKLFRGFDWGVGIEGYSRSFTSMPNSLQIFQCMYAGALLWRCMYSVLVQGSQRSGGQWSRRKGHTVCILDPRQASWEYCVRRRWSWAALIKPSVSALRPTPLSHLWVLSWSTSACFTCCGYLPWSAFNSHLDLSCCYLRDLKVVSAVEGLRKSLGVPFYT